MSTIRHARAGAALLAWLVAATPAGAIVGTAQPAPALEASTLMLLQRAGGLAGFCSAVVIRQDVLLTAAHCAPSGAELKAHYRDGGRPVLLDVAAVERHPAFRPDAIRSRQRSIDLALVRLAAPLPARFAPLSFSDRQGAPVGEAFRLAGFGLAREGEAGTSGVLRTGLVTARPPLSGVLLWAGGAGGTGACTGDSGGPVLERGSDTVVAVTAWSAGTGRAQCGALTQAVWIGPHRAWIEDVLRAWGR